MPSGGIFRRTCEIETPARYRRNTRRYAPYGHRKVTDMGVEAQTAQSSSGLATVVDTIAAPRTAFERIRQQPTWGWAFLIAFVLMIVGSILTAPAQQHAQVASLQRNFSKPVYASVSDARKQAILNNAEHPSVGARVFGYAAVGIVLLLFVFFNTLLVLIGNAIGGGDGTFKRYWAGSMNIAIPTAALSTIVVGIICMLRGADSFNSSIDIAAAAPSLGMFIHPSPAATVFFSSISIFSLWGLYLNATQMQVNNVNKTTAWATAIIILLAGASMYAGLIQALANLGFV